MSRDCIFSIDVGIKNLSFCIIKKDRRIQLWDTYDIIESKEPQLCKEIQKNGKICNRKCSFMGSETYYCKTHSKNKKVKKYTHTKTLVKSISLQSLVVSLLKLINKVYIDHKQIFDSVYLVNIELQPSKNPKMKMLSNVLYGKLIDLYLNTSTVIKFVRATRKLKVYKGPPIECSLKNAYSKRKWLAIEHSKYLLTTTFDQEECNKWMAKLTNGKADNADSFLYCLMQLK